MADTNIPLFERLKDANAEDWQAYTDHAFVRGLADGSLAEASFRHYLVQDYLFLIHFARAYALAVYKSGTLAQMREAAASMSAILDVEMNLHVQFCEGWGLARDDIESTAEATATMAYTRYVLERGAAGDLLDLHTALAPCVIGYAEIGARLAADAGTKRDGNPYWPWIEEYASEAYQDVAAGAKRNLDALSADRMTEARFPALSVTFGQATRLEAQFWQMGLDRSW